MPFTEGFKVNSPNVKYEKDNIISNYQYQHNVVKFTNGEAVVTPMNTNFTFKTDRHVPKLGVMIVGLGGNNGTTVVAGTIANKMGISWRTNKGVQTPNYYGSLTQCSTLKLGIDENGEDVFIPFNKILPMVNPNEIVYGGWDINNMNLAEAMERAQVLNYDLQRQLVPYMKNIIPLPSIYIPDFIAANQADRANNLIKGTREEQLAQLRKDIRDFKQNNKCDRVIVIWSANTERYSDVITGVNDTAENLLQSIKNSHSEVSPSTIFAVASILEGCAYVNGSPQNTFVPGLIELAIQKKC